MKRTGLEPAYEAARSWAVQPISHPPLGWAQIVRCGVAAWISAAPRSLAVPLHESHQAPVNLSSLLTLVAAMIAEVCQ